MSTRSFAPRDGRVLGTVPDTTASELAASLAAATTAASHLADCSPSQRQRWVNAIADAIQAHHTELAELADSETALGISRLRSEVSRAAEQLRFYGRVSAAGAYLGFTRDDATETGPRIVRINRPLGPVAVFGASNFPFAFGVLGNDTASALSAGCPVIAKAHPAHALTCRRLAEVAADALRAADAPEGAYSVVNGMAVGVELVRADGVKAVGFTGSQNGGLALWRIANERGVVIPVYAEMGTVNPVVLTRHGVAHLDGVAKGFVGSFTLGAGQFCSKPGVLFAPVGSNAAAAVAAALNDAAPRPVMLTEAIAKNVDDGLETLVDAGATVEARVPGSGVGWSADAAVLSAPIDALKHGSRLLEECFGPVAIVVEYDDDAELDRALSVLQGSLAASVFGDGDDDPEIARLVARLVGQVGRVTVGDWPTGVACTWAQQHGGPWPATSNPRTTSVGAAALDRFVRPVAFQSVPDVALPPGVSEAAAQDNPWAIQRRVNGRVESP